jgi:hypothetical protein
MAPATAAGPPPRFVCPVCEAPWRSDTNVCTSCGADLYDPDVQAFAQGRAPGTVPVGANDPAREAASGDAGTLGAGQILGVRAEGLADGSALRRLGVVGGLALLVAFVLPALREFEREGARWIGDDWHFVGILKFSWDLMGQGHALALVYPLVAGVGGIALGLVPGLSPAWRGKLLALLGLVGIVVSAGPLGTYALAPTDLATLPTLGILVAGGAMAWRMLAPGSVRARQALVAAGVIFVVGMVLPVADLAPRLPFDYSFDRLNVELAHAVPVVQIARGLDRRALALFFVAVWLLAPLVLVPAAAALSWRKPRGVWDKDGLALRPLAWVLVLYLPILYALMAFSATGWEDQLSKSAVLGRTRLILVVAPFALWAQLGMLAALVAGAAKVHQVPEAATRE